MASGKPADDPSLLISGIGRAEAMAYRDARVQAMTDPDWSETAARLPVAEGGRGGWRLVKAHAAKTAEFPADAKKPRTMPGLLGC